VWLQNGQDITLLSNADGSARTTILTPSQYWGLPLGISDLLAGLRVSQLTTNAGVTVKWQYSLDGRFWRTGATVISQVTAVDDYTALFNTAAQKTPFGRLVAELQDTSVGNSQMTAVVTSWGLYRYC